MQSERKQAVQKLLLAILVLASAGTGQAAEVKYDADTSVDVTRWSAFALKAGEAGSRSPIAESRLRRTLEAGFVARGYRLAEPGEAEFLVAYQTALRRDLRLDESLGPRWGRSLRADIQAVGVLVVDVYERQSGRLVWRGAVSDAMASEPEKADEKTEKAVSELLKKFPARKAP
ncbi:MAG: DUF4136 domain-containing protein [Vicinamibacteria bacterium]